MRKILISLVFIGLTASTAAVSQVGKTPYWMSQKYQASMRYMLANISPEGAKKGVVIASPSTERPNYYFHWVRDGALVMNSIIDVYIIAQTREEKNRWEKMLIEYAVFSRDNQKAKTKTGLGEPKFNIDGTGFEGPWGRPQFDGPALRAAVLARFAGVLAQYGKQDIIRKYLWDPKKPEDSVIKTDLDFTLKVLNSSSFDLWEESKGTHFFTVMAQRKALRMGAKLARALGQYLDSEKYRRGYGYLTSSMNAFWDPSRDFYVSAIRRTGGIGYKASNMDTSLIIAANFAEFTDRSGGSLEDPRMLRMFSLFETTFSKLYYINQNYEVAPLIGRYPEDRYNGVNSTIGNPWFITTHAFGEFLYKFALRLMRRNEIVINDMTFDFYKSLGVEIKEKEVIKRKDKRFGEIIDRLFKKGDTFLLHAQRHTGAGYRMSEQMNRNSGFMQGARDLTWSYASYVTAYFSRHRSATLLNRRNR